MHCTSKTEIADLTKIATEQYRKGQLQPAYGYFDDLHKCQAAEIVELKTELASVVKGVGIRIPTNTMEQQFAYYERRGYAKASSEIAELKAKLAEVMPLAKFGAGVANDYVGGVCFARADYLNSKALTTGVVNYDYSYTANIEATIGKLLKD